MDIEGKVKLFGADVAKEVVVTLITEEFVNLLVPALSTAFFGMPITFKIVKILLGEIRK
jgi:hypothetical protein